MRLKHPGLRPVRAPRQHQRNLLRPGWQPRRPVKRQRDQSSPQPLRPTERDADDHACPNRYARPRLPRALVVRVIDGDTIELQGGARLRYIGVDTPETVVPGQPVGCYGPEASARNKALVEGKVVGLEKDVSETDSFGRLLRYVYIDGLMVNEPLVRDGYAQVSTYPPDVKYVDRFLAAQQEAQAADRGLWGGCQGPRATPPSTTGNCDPAYPTVCIPSPPPDLDCPDVPYTDFQVLPPDPHGFDGNKDGIGCQS